MTAHEPTDKESKHAYRARMRAKGYKPVTFWVPDVNSPEFKEQARRDCLAIKNSAEEKDVNNWLDSIWDENEANGFYGPAPDFRK